MKIPTLPFTVTDWSEVPATKHSGETGEALWRTLNIGDLRVRMVEYSPGYFADHWCDRGHVKMIVPPDVRPETLREWAKEADGIIVRAKLPDDIVDHVASRSRHAVASFATRRTAPSIG